MLSSTLPNPLVLIQELARADPEAEPETADAFEALVAGQPDSSHAWIRYMAFLLTLGDADAARAVAERALNTINYRFVYLFTSVSSCKTGLVSGFGMDPVHGLPADAGRRRWRARGGGAGTHHHQSQVCTIWTLMSI